MIIVVEGPSGAGKTTWVQRHGGRFGLLEQLPDHTTVPTDPEQAARFWVQRNVARWQEVLERERRDGVVVVDTDPFKLHYVWTLWRTGQATEREWILQRDVAREAFATGRYGLADLFLVSEISMDELRRRKDADPTRTRHSFEHHVQLRDSLLAWYRSITTFDAQRVVFGLPGAGLAPELLALGPRSERSGRALFDRLLASLETQDC